MTSTFTLYALVAILAVALLLHMKNDHQQPQGVTVSDETSEKLGELLYATNSDVEIRLTDLRTGKTQVSYTQHGLFEDEPMAEAIGRTLQNMWRQLQAPS